MTDSSETPEASSTTSEADADNTTPSAAPEDASIAGVSDEQLPEDLQPGEDNPLAEPLDPDAEETKDPEELGMQDTQADTAGSYESTGPTPSTEDPDHSDTDSAASASASAQEPSED